jgi:hypothetical protein
MMGGIGCFPKKEKVEEVPRSPARYYIIVPEFVHEFRHLDLFQYVC